MSRISRVKGYFGTNLYIQWPTERVFLQKAKMMTEMLDNCVVIRADHVSRNGVADLLLCYKGYFVACELKAAGGAPSEPQLAFIEKILKASGSAAVCSTLEEVLKTIIRAVPEPKF